MFDGICREFVNDYRERLRKPTTEPNRWPDQVELIGAAIRSKLETDEFLQRAMIHARSRGYISVCDSAKAPFQRIAQFRYCRTTLGRQFDDSQN
jgi:hypothetical protein